MFGSHIQHEDTSYKIWESFAYVDHTMEDHKQSSYLVERGKCPAPSLTDYMNLNTVYKVPGLHIPL